MTCFIQGLLPYDRVSDEAARRNADAHGGFGMGTWDFPVYIDLLSRALGEDVKTPYPEAIPVDDPCAPESRGYWLNRVYTTEECERVATYLRSMKRVRHRDWTAGNRSRICVSYGPFRGLGLREPCFVYLYRHRRMISLFRHGPVTWYSI